MTPVIFVRFSEIKDIDPKCGHKSGVSNLMEELALTASLPDVAYVLHSHWEDFHAPGSASGVSPMVTAALNFFRKRLPVFRASVLPGTDGSVEGLAAMNSTSQCFILWSKVSSPLSVDITLTLRRPLLGLQLPKTFELLTLGPRQSDFFTYKTVPLPPPPAIKPRLYIVQYHYLKKFLRTVPLHFKNLKMH